ncbi:MAG: hypothetical protein N5P05_003093 [Chroococcopsis gigantea SAG 12.99]|jgi:hypothetical protein|nr:hypothetical protein [Chlorogloea purpurea SAG 13.99]MDV3001487.1 hypothetical protein [Chroococcopsis gigantea SAG 12.99]
MRWEDFLRKMADEYALTRTQSEIFLIRLSEEYKSYEESKFYPYLDRDDRLKYIALANYKKQLTEIYGKFEFKERNGRGCKEISRSSRDKFQKLRQWLEGQYAMEISTIEFTNTSVSLTDDMNDDSRTDWDHVCSQMLSIDTDRAIHNLNLYKIPTVSSRLKSELTDSQGHRYEWEDTGFFEFLLDDNRHKNIVISSQSSIGKILFMQKLGSYIHSADKGYPLYISTSEIAEKSLPNYLVQNWLQSSLTYIPDRLELTPELKNEFINLFKNQNVWLLIDVDKFIKKPKQVISSILSSRATGFLRKANIVLSCKPKIWRACQYRFDDLEFATYTILPLTPVQVEDFIKRRFRKNPQLGEELQHKLTQLDDRRIGQLIQNPSYLVRLCENWSATHRQSIDDSDKFFQGFQNTYAYWRFLILGN